MERLVAYAIVLTGPCFGVMLVCLIAGRRLFRDVQILFDLSEWVLLIIGAIVAIAVAGVVVQLV